MSQPAHSSVETVIEKLVYGGDGLARMATPGEAAHSGGRGKTLLVPGVLPGERVRVAIEEEDRSLARGRVEEILESSPDRIAPACEYFGRCGGCQWQFAEAQTQLARKEEILRETLRRTSHIEWAGAIALHSAEPWGYRNRIRLHILPGRKGENLQPGYYEHNSHRLLPVTHCPIASPLLNQAIAALLQLPAPPATAREVELTADNAGAQLTACFHFEEVTGRERDYARAAAEALPQCAAVAVASGPEGEPETVAGEAGLTFAVGEFSYRVHPGAFFQVNRFLAEELVSAVTSGVEGGAALDLYAGVGLFTLPLARSFKRVHAVESHPVAAADLRQNTSPLGGVKVVERPVQEWALRRGPRPSVDLVVADPPRTGLGRALTRWLTELEPARIHAVSCDPTTLARDLAPLLQAGYSIEAMHLFDLFPQTFHIETVVRLVKG